MNDDVYAVVIPTENVHMPTYDTVSAAEMFGWMLFNACYDITEDGKIWLGVTPMGNRNYICTPTPQD